MIEYKDALAVLLGYAIGCFSTGYYLTRLCTGKDIRTSGSSSTGARNVGRVLGKTGFIITFAGDAAKGALAAWLASMLTTHHWIITASLIAAAVGHIWPAQLGFHGGKAIAVTFGGILLLDYRLAVACCIVFAVCLLCSIKYMPSGLAAVITAPIAAALKGYSAGDFIGILVLIIMILIAHRSNIAELVPKNQLREADKNVPNS